MKNLGKWGGMVSSGELVPDLYASCDVACQPVVDGVVTLLGSGGQGACEEATWVRRGLRTVRREGWS